MVVVTGVQTAMVRHSRRSYIDCLWNYSYLTKLPELWTSMCCIWWRIYHSRSTLGWLVDRKTPDLYDGSVLDMHRRCVNHTVSATQLKEPSKVEKGCIFHSVAYVTYIMKFRLGGSPAPFREYCYFPLHMRVTTLNITFRSHCY